MYKNTEIRLKLLKEAKKVLSQLEKMNIENAALRSVSGEECSYRADEIRHLVMLYKEFCLKAKNIDPDIYPPTDPVIFSETGFALVREYTAHLKIQIETEQKALELSASSKDS